MSRLTSGALERLAKEDIYTLQTLSLTLIEKRTSPLNPRLKIGTLKSDLCVLMEDVNRGGRLRHLDLSGAHGLSPMGQVKSTARLKLRLYLNNPDVVRPHFLG